MERNLVKIQNLLIDTFTFEEAIEYAQNGQVVTLNPEMIDAASKNPDLTNIIREAELVIPDGIGVQLGLKILGHDVKRIAGIEFARKILEKYTLIGKSVALVGAKPEVIEKTVQNLKKEIPGINIVYYHDGYFNDDNEILTCLQNSRPDVVLTALGFPKQEVFNYKGKKLLPETLFIGVGGSFDVWSGTVERAPEIYQKLCIEWLYRTIKDPKRFKRIFPTLPMFVLKVLKEKVTGV
ncbi:glycosyltransferase [Candidatus Gastranaerophilales bacterium]|nr:MAG: glycosyltransferase [Candidatus Gastranaerophilales bacterium]